MDTFDSASANGSFKSARGGSPHRLLTKSYPPVKQHHREHNASVDVKLTDLMDEDEVRWMSNAESSRSPTPSQAVAGAPQESSKQKQQKQEYKDGFQRAFSTVHKSGSVVRIETPPPMAERLGYARNTTPPLPPLPIPRESATMKQHARPMPETVGGLTALPQRIPSSKPTSFAQRVFMAAKADLLYDYVERGRLPWRFRQYKHGALDIATLARMQKYVTQQKLIEQVRAIGHKGAWLEIGIADTIKEYCQINRDIDYMRQHAYGGSQSDPFLITTSRSLEAQLLEDAGMARRNEHFEHRLEDHSFPRIARPNRHSPCSQMMRRLTIVVLVGLAMLAPYLIAVMAPTQLARVLTVCICIVAFATAATMLSLRKRSAKWPAGLTLVYAAALVIFIGVDPSRYTAR